jgi:predicted Holliday junction resolvase-like endonuclease
MTQDYLRAAFIAAVAVALLLALLLALAVSRILRQARDLARQKQLVDEEGRRRVDKSRSVLLGQVAEHMAPLLPGFGLNPKDARFLGQPVDYLVFDGLSEGAEIEVVFLEIKTGGSRLSASELAIKRAVEAGRVRFEVRRLGSDGALRED